MAGHTFQDSAEAVGLLKSTDGGCIFKPHSKRTCAEREKWFYQRLCHDPLLAEMRRFVPEYHGCKVLNIRGKDVEFLQLTDVTAGMSEPCVIDCKIGKRTWDPLATEEKRLVESSKYLASRNAVGFCIPGFQVFSLSAGKMKRYGREYGKALDGNSVYETFRLFLNADLALYRPLVARILASLKDIQHWAHNQREFNIYSSSVLIVYDAKRLKEMIDTKALPPANLHLQLEPAATSKVTEWIHVKMIDFAHTFLNEDGTADLNYIEGVNHLVEIFERLLQEAQN